MQENLYNCLVMIKKSRKFLNYIKISKAINKSYISRFSYTTSFSEIPTKLKYKYVSVIFDLTSE